MVYGFVKQSNGHIRIESEEGVGTTVRIYVPQAKGVAVPAEPDGIAPWKAATRPLWWSRRIVCYSDSAVIHDGHLDAGVLLLAKPYQKSDLARMIRAALAA